MARIGYVVIGRNEGARLIACLDALGALPADVRGPVIYVDSGSTDGSVTAARDRGAEVVALDMELPFTAGRARNAGFARLTDRDAPPDVVQFIDGDCQIDRAWPGAALEALDTRPDVVIVCGRLRERFPEATVWNRLADAEWDTPVGEAEACGGIFAVRAAAFAAVAGFREDLIAGEEPELCLRLRRAGGRIRRLDAEMARHDIAMTRLGQWWTRARRAGHTYAEGAALYGSGPERYNVARQRRALLWGAGLPLAIVLGLVLVGPWALLLALAWPAQVLRQRIKGESWTRAVFLALGKLPEAQGILAYHLGRLRGRRAAIIEYK